MNFKTTYILFGVLVVLLLMLGVALFTEPGPKEASNWALPSVHRKDTEIKAEDVTRAEIKRTTDKGQAETIVFERDADGKTWRVTEPAPLRANSTEVTGLVRDVLDARRDAEADTPHSLKDFGLDPPGEVVTLTKGDRKVELNVGNTSPGKENQVVFVTSSDNPKEAVPVKKRELDSVFKPLNEFRDRTLLANSSFDIRSVKISEPKKQTVALTKEDEGHWKYTEPPYGAADTEGETPLPGAPPGVPSGVNPLLTDVTNLRVEKNEDFVADGVADKDLGKYNLDPDKDPILRVEVEKSEGTKEEKKPDAKQSLLVGVGKAVDGKYYARLDGEKSVIRVAAKDVDPLRKLLDDPMAVRDRTLVRVDSTRTPDGLEIKNDAGTYELIHQELKPWELYRGDKSTKADDKAVQDLITQLTQKHGVRTFPDPKTTTEAALGLDKPSAVVSVWVDGVVKDEKKDGEKKEEKKDEKKDAKEGEKKDEKKEEKKPARPKLKEKPTARLTFGGVADNLVAVKREAGGETTLLKVPANILDRVKSGALAYTDKVLPKFNDFDASKDVTKLVLVRGGVTTELTHDPKASATAGSWKFDKPAELAGRTADAPAVDSVLRALNNLRAAKLVSEKPDPQVFDREFGLKTPTTKATVTVTKDGKSTSYDYDFGKDADMTKTYARQSQRPDIVFEVDKGELTPLGADLRDPTIFRFDAAKAKAVKMTGWKNLTGSPFVLELERKDGSTWTAKAPKDFAVSQDKVNRLVTGLSTERAVKFLDRKLTPKEREDDGLQADKGGLVIEITVEGEKEPFVLTVGNADGDKGDYLATANRLGDALFTVRKDVFEKPKEKPAFFNP